MDDMSKTLRVSDDVEAVIASKGTLHDTYDSVLRRVLGMPLAGRPASKNHKGGRGNKRTDVTGREAYRPLIRQILLAKPGKQAKTAEVLDEIESRMSGKFLPGDTKRRKSGQLVWRNNAEWMRKQMVMDGELQGADEAGFGCWKLA
jgi:hypothetical protein